MAIDKECDRALGEELAQFARGELTGLRQEDLRAHVASCVVCQKVVSGFEGLWRDVEGVGTRPLQVDLWPGVQSRIVSLPPRATLRASVRVARFGIPALLAAGLIGLFMSRKSSVHVPSAQALVVATGAHALARPSIETLDRALREVERAAATSPDDPYLRRLLTRTRADRAAFAAQVDAMAAAAR